jgi:hypothetical protein
MTDMDQHQAYYPSGEIMKVIPDVDSIYTEYHPSSGQPPTIKPLQEHNHRLFPSNILPEERPWEPFRTRLDFEVLEFAMEVGLNQTQLASYIELIHRTVTVASNDDEKFGVQNADEAMKLWELAASRRVAVRCICHI